MTSLSFNDLSGQRQTLTTNDGHEEYRLWVAMWSDKWGVLTNRFEYRGLNAPSGDSWPEYAGSYERAVQLLASIRVNP